MQDPSLCHFWTTWSQLFYNMVRCLKLERSYTTEIFCLVFGINLVHMILLCFENEPWSLKYDPGIILLWCIFMTWTCVCFGRSWEAFERCVSSVLSDCRGNAAELWESLKAESRRMQYSGNLYEMCASRAVTSPQTPPTTDQTNQESLKGRGVSSVHARAVCVFLVCVFCEMIWFI